MKTVSQVAKLTGISVRTLQYYDEIGLLTPSQITPAGYRLYDETALEQLQQILFFKELNFKLSEIKEIMLQPDFDRIAAFRKQKQLLHMKRNRLNDLIALLEKLEKGEVCMSFKEFDLSEYINALEQFKTDQAAEVIEHWGSIEKFNQFIEKIRNDEEHLAQIAIKQFGSVKKYTEAMKKNLSHFSELMAQYEVLSKNKEDILQKQEALYRRLTADRTRDPASAEIQDIVAEMIAFTQETAIVTDLGEGYWDMVIDCYLNEQYRSVTDSKYGEGASEYIGNALRAYFQS